MKILWFTNTPCGATEKLTCTKVTGGGWLYTLSEALNDIDNIDLHIAFYWKEELDSFILNGITYHPIASNGLSNGINRLISSFKMLLGINNDELMIPKLDKIITEINPDIIHVHGSEMNFGLVAKKWSNKVVLSIQGLISPYYNKLFSGYPKKMVAKNNTLMDKLLLRDVNATERRMCLQAETEKKIFKNVKYIIGRTEWDKACSLALNPNRRYFVVNEILRSDFFSVVWEPRHNTNLFRIVTTVSNGLYKGVESIYSTAKILKEAGVNFAWDVIGVSSKDYIVSLTESIEGNNHDQLNINLLGRRDAEGMICALTSADLFVQVSHIENSPNSLCEAMLLGMPVVASFAGGTSSMLDNGIEGVLLQDGDPYVLAGTIMQVATNFEKYVSMGAKARIRALQRHNPSNVVNELLNVYNQVINDK